MKKYDVAIIGAGPAGMTAAIHRDAIDPGQRVLIVDDLLATGGTAAAKLVEELGGQGGDCLSSGIGVPERPVAVGGIYGRELYQILDTSNISQHLILESDIENRISVQTCCILKQVR